MINNYWNAVPACDGTALQNINTFPYRNQPALISAATFGGKTIVDFSSGINTAHVLTSDGKIYRCGDNTNYQVQHFIILNSSFTILLLQQQPLLQQTLDHTLVTLQHRTNLYFELQKTWIQYFQTTMEQ
jgi:alpha-tubulin suppressor-like RCC1 family protein